MEIITLILIIIGLCLFEAVNSVDNAVINAEVLSTMRQRARRWFLSWGFVIAVVVPRGLLPWMIVWSVLPGLGAWQAFTATFSSDPHIIDAVHTASPFLLIGAGTFLVFLFFHWLFIEPKNYGIRGEEFFHRQGIWFFALVSVLLASIVWFALKINPYLAFAAVLGSTIFFITHGFKQYAEEGEKRLMKSGVSDISKILYLEVIDASFSIDGVLGAFAFTLSIPLIILGNGLGAFLVRYLTVKNIETIKKYRYLKNGAMYSLFVLGCIMLADAFGAEIPEWASPIVTIFVIGYFFLKSKREVVRGADS
ncbi:TPA: DUF475 domain-containing protein [Candidatus Woesearchaeota archaeon]|nr:DUF475 domain-containing protein [Candidatus Woesearchaeota archaeon]HII64787.1 DUF475 domain-containing protein [Candidatus Woesearchaeota archaeon]